MVGEIIDLPDAIRAEAKRVNFSNPIRPHTVGAQLEDVFQREVFSPTPAMLCTYSGFAP